MISKVLKLTLKYAALTVCLLSNLVKCSPETVGRHTHCHNIIMPSSRVAFAVVSARIGLQRNNKVVRSAITLSSAPSKHDEVHISIEYCSACQWMLRSTWIASELLTTFAQESKLASVTLLPKSPPLSPGGIFRVVSRSDRGLETVLWDRSIEGRFPEAKEVKQAVRDVVSPGKDLGHSDKKEVSKREKDSISSGNINSSQVECLECKEKGETSGQDSPSKESDTQSQHSFHPAFYENDMISIEYSTGTKISSLENKMYRAIWYANELLNMVYERNAWLKENEGWQQSADAMRDIIVPVTVDAVTLIPIRGKVDVLNIRLNDNIIFDQSKFEKYERDSRIRRIVSESLSGGSTVSVSSGPDIKNEEFSIEMMSEEEANEARKYFGVF